MARHLLIGAEASSAASAGVVTAGGIQIQKESASGPTELALGDSVADAPRIRFVQGHAEGNRFSPWISGRNIVDWSGKSEETPVACTVTNTIAGTSAAAGTLVLKFVRIGGPAPEFFSFSTAIAASVAHTAADALVKTAFEALNNIPDWLNATADATAGATVVFSGALRGDVAQSGNVWEEAPANIQLIVESYDGGTQTHTASVSANPDPGVGDGNLLRELEENLQGIQFGYYDRLKLPKQPALAAVAATNYDVWNIVATKDGSTSSSINGVDNLIEIMVANTAGSGANALAFENKLNAYCGSIGFANVTL